MYDIQVLIKNIQNLAESKGISINQMLNEARLTKSLIDNMKRNQNPSIDKIYAIAEYFDVSLDYLVGRSDDHYPISYTSEYNNCFRQRLNEIIPTLDVHDAEAAYIDLPMYSKLVNGEKKISFDLACMIADEMGISLDYLVGLTDDSEFPSIATEYLSNDEITLIEKFRTLDPDKRKAIETLLS